MKVRWYIEVFHKQASWLKPFKPRQIDERAATDSKFLEECYKVLVIAFYGKTMEVFPNRLHKTFVKCGDTEEVFNQQKKQQLRLSNPTVISIASFKKQKAPCGKPVFLEFSLAEDFKLHLYETYHEVLNLNLETLDNIF